MTEFPGDGDDVPNDLVVQPGDRILVAGHTEGGSGYDFALARYMADGRLDRTFGSGGLLTTDFMGGEDLATAVSLYPDRRILVAGLASSEGNADLALARYLDDYLSDDFEDGTMNWDVYEGVWSESGGDLVAVARHAAVAAPPVPWSPSGAAGCSRCTIRTVLSTSGGPASSVTVQGWYGNDGSVVELEMEEKKDRWTIRQISGGRLVSSKTASAPIEPGVSYELDMGFDGTEFQLRVDGRTLLRIPAAEVSPGAVRLGARKTTARFRSLTIF